MEDIDHLVFHNEPSQQIFYKPLLSSEEVLDFRNCFVKRFDQISSVSGGLATGNRKRLEIDLQEDVMSDIRERIVTVLRDYFPDIQLASTARMYSQDFGGIKPHRDASLDGASSYTLLIYMSDNFDGGKLSLKLKRTDEEKSLLEPSKHHKVFTFTPKMGYGIIFRKNILHWAEEVLEGDKMIILFDIISAF